MSPKRAEQTQSTRRRSSKSAASIDDSPPAARALQSVTISFGLVSIPAEIYPAANPAGRVSFNLLHSCGSRVKQEYRCVEEDKIVPREELVKGYEFEQELCHFLQGGTEGAQRDRFRADHDRPVPVGREE